MNTKSRATPPSSNQVLDPRLLGRPVHLLPLFSARLQDDLDELFRAGMNRRYRASFKVGEVTMTSVAAYDGARLIYKMIEATDGQRDPDKAIAAVKGMQWMSPRGPVSIDPETRHIRQNVYLRKVENVDGKLVNKEIETYKDQPDWGLEKH